MARAAIKAIKAGEDRSGPQSFTAMAEQWFKRHVEAKGLRSAVPYQDIPQSMHILPAWAGREFDRDPSGRCQANCWMALRIAAARCCRQVLTLVQQYL